MRHLIYIILFYYPILFCLPYSTVAQAGNKTITVVIDPGHGGIDTGATGSNGLIEKEINLKLARELFRLNIKEKYLNIYLSRYIDTLISLQDRTKLAKALNADYFISLHCNHSSSPIAKGIEIFVPRSGPPGNLKESIFIANEIQRSLTTQFGIKSRGIKFEDFLVLKESIKFAPSILVELCFISNKEEANFISNQVNLEAIALSVYSSIKKLRQ